jgi:hypothetical protein
MIKNKIFNRSERLEKNPHNTLAFSNLQAIFASIYNKFADIVSTCLSAQLYSQVNMQVNSVKLMTYRKYTRSSSVPAAFAVINMEPLKCNAILELDLLTGSSIINRLCGGLVEERLDTYKKPTDIEIALLEGITVSILENMREAWGIIKDLKPSLRHINVNPALIQITRPKDKVIIVSLEITIDGIKGKMKFCIPYFFIEPLLVKFSEKYINSAVSDIQVDLIDEIRELKYNIIEFKKDTASNITCLIKEFKSFFESKGDEILFEEIDYAASLSLIARNNIETVVEIIRFYLMQDEHLKAAVVFIALGHELSIKIFKRLREDEIELLTFDIARLEIIDNKQKQTILKEFYDSCQNKQNVSTGGIDYARVLLENSVGAQKTLDIIDRLTSSLQVRPFDFIRRAEPDNLLIFIRREHPQTIALILSYLEPEKAAIILQKFPVVCQIEIVRRIDKLGKTSPEVLREIEKVLERQLSLLSITDYCLSGGSENVEEILNNLDPESRKQIVGVLKS